MKWTRLQPSVLTSVVEPPVVLLDEHRVLRPIPLPLGLASPVQAATRFQAPPPRVADELIGARIQLLARRIVRSTSGDGGLPAALLQLPPNPRQLLPNPPQLINHVPHVVIRRPLRHRRSRPKNLNHCNQRQHQDNGSRIRIRFTHLPPTSTTVAVHWMLLQEHAP